jgi:hypothetical protein
LIEALGIVDGEIQMDVAVIDPATGEASDGVQRVTMEEIQ